MATTECDMAGQASHQLQGVNNHILYRFIQMYRERPVLWNSSLKIYGDKGEKSKAYKELLAILQDLNKDATIIDVKKKINSLRTNYRKRVKDRISSGAEDIYGTTFWVDRELRFLVQEMGEIVGDNNIQQEQQQQEQQQESSFAPVKVEVISDWELGMDYQDNAAAMTASSPTQNSKGKLNQIYCETWNGNEEETNDKIWIGKLKSMSSEQKHLTNKFMDDLLTQGEMGTLYPHTAGTSENPISDMKPSLNSSSSCDNDPLIVNNHYPNNHVYPSVNLNVSKKSTSCEGSHDNEHISTSYESLDDKEQPSTLYVRLHNKEQPKPSRCPEKEDEFDIVGRRVAYQLRGMEERQRLIAEKLVSDVMFQGRLGKLDENSFVCLSPLGPATSSKVPP